MATTCKHLEVENSYIDSIGGKRIPYSSYYCNLKKADEGIKMKMNYMFFKMGVVGSFPGDECPFALREDFDNCPLYESEA